MLVRSSILAVTAVIISVSGAGLTACAMKQPQETVGQYVDGGITTTQVKTAILADKSLSNTTITVKTYKNVVQLGGFVNTSAQKMQAEKIVRDIGGKSIIVDNAIIVK